MEQNDQTTFAFSKGLFEKYNEQEKKQKKQGRSNDLHDTTLQSIPEVS